MLYFLHNFYKQGCKDLNFENNKVLNVILELILFGDIEYFSKSVMCTGFCQRGENFDTPLEGGGCNGE